MELQSAHNLLGLVSFTYHHVLSQSSYKVVTYVGCFLPHGRIISYRLDRPHCTHLLITGWSYFSILVLLSFLSPRPKEIFWAFSLQAASPRDPKLNVYPLVFPISKALLCLTWGQRQKAPSDLSLLCLREAASWAGGFTGSPTPNLL